MCQQADTEIGGYGLLDPEKPLYIRDLIIPQQTCTLSFCDLDTEDLSLRWEDLQEKGFQPWQYSTVWIHTHPGISAQPSGQDWSTFDSLNGPYQVMFILAKEGQTHATVKVTKPLTMKTEIPVVIDWTAAGEVNSERMKNEVAEGLLLVKKGFVYSGPYHQGNNFWQQRDLERKEEEERRRKEKGPREKGRKGKKSTTDLPSIPSVYDSDETWDDYAERLYGHRPSDR